jgi:hypothetical protein
VTDLLLLSAWIEARKGNGEKAANMLLCTRRLVESTGDVLLTWFQKAVESAAKRSPEGMAQSKQGTSR